jgi:hypothetical protein
LKLSKEDNGSEIDPTLFKRLVGSLIYLTTTKALYYVWSEFDFKVHGTPKECH